MAYTGEIRLWAGPTAPNGWAFCGGTALPIQGNEVLAMLLGAVFGSDSPTTVNLPDLRSRTIVSGAVGYIQPGVAYGFETVSIAPGVIPNHTHTGLSKDTTQNSTDPTNNSLAVPSSGNAYSTNAPNVSLARDTVSITGTSAAHNNIQPYCALNFIICIAGGIAPTNGSTSGGSFSSFGGMLLFAAFSSVLPAHYKRLDLSELSRTTFSGLFGLTGTTFGAGDGSTTFNLPDLRGLTICGAGTAADSLAVAITSTLATSVTATSGSRIFNGTVIQVGTEKMLVVSGGTTANLVVTRGFLGTTAATHLISSTINVLSTYAVGATAGEAAHILSSSELPPHRHTFGAVSEAGNLSSPANNYLASSALFHTGSGPDAMAPSHIFEVGPQSPAPNLPHENRQPFLGITILLAVDDVTPDMNTGEIYAGLWASAPAGTVLCDGASYTTSGQAALFAVIGYTFGGSGSNFNVPDLRGRVPMGVGQGIYQGTNLSNYTLGQYGGEEAHVLTVAEMPAHAHPVYADGAAAGDPSPFVHSLASRSNTYRASGTPVTLDASAIQNTGSGSPHENRMPTMAFTFVIKL